MFSRNLLSGALLEAGAHVRMYVRNACFQGSKFARFFTMVNLNIPLNLSVLWGLNMTLCSCDFLSGILLHVHMYVRNTCFQGTKFTRIFTMVKGTFLKHSFWTSLPSNSERACKFIDLARNREVGSPLSRQESSLPTIPLTYILSVPLLLKVHLEWASWVSPLFLLGLPSLLNFEVVYLRIYLLYIL